MLGGVKARRGARYRGAGNRSLRRMTAVPERNSRAGERGTAQGRGEQARGALTVPGEQDAAPGDPKETAEEGGDPPAQEGQAPGTPPDTAG